MLEIKNLCARYGKNTVLTDINLTFEKGKFYAVIGKNSSGKSTLMSCIMSLKKYDGSICVDALDVPHLSDRERAKRMSFLAQQPERTGFTVYDLCALGRNHSGDSAEKVRVSVMNALETAGISHLADKSVNEISGGERQLSYFAMNLCQDSDIMILDEPTSSLDLEHETKILFCAKKLCEKGKTVICVMHNLSKAIKYADSVVVLDRGRCVFFGNKNECLDGKVIENCFGVRRFSDEEEIFFSI